jgi:murein L,D-transpeptidase YafK
VKRSAIIAGTVALAFTVTILWAQRSAPALPENTRADLVVVNKSVRTLELYRGTELLRSYNVSLGRDPSGPKQREGDGRTPEGKYTLDYRKENSSFHRSLHISYPSPDEVKAAKAKGANPGGLIMVHGLRNGLGVVGRLHTAIDWTDGCVAVTNREIEEIWRVVPDGTPIVIKP